MAENFNALIAQVHQDRSYRLLARAAVLTPRRCTVIRAQEGKAPADAPRERGLTIMQRMCTLWKRPD